MKALGTLFLLLLGALVLAQEPYIYFKGAQTLVLYRPKRISTDHLQDIRVGQTILRVYDETLGEMKVKRYMNHSEIWPHAGGPDQQINIEMDSWVSVDGKVQKVRSTWQKGTTLYVAEAKRIDDDTMEITTSKNNGPKKTTQMMVAGGNQMFDAAFVGVANIKDAKPEDRLEYYTLDPEKGTPVKNLARIKNRVFGKFDDKEYKGLSVEITNPSGKTIAYVSSEGLILQVDFEKGVRLLPIEYDPKITFSPPPGVQRGGGG